MYFLRIAGIDDDACGFNIYFLSGIIARPSCATGVASSLQPAVLGLEIFQSNSATLSVFTPSQGWQLRIIDIFGREVLTTALQQNDNQLHVGDLLRGTYFIVVQNGNQLASEKWVKR